MCTINITNSETSGINYGTGDGNNYPTGFPNSEAYIDSFESISNSGVPVSVIDPATGLWRYIQRNPNYVSHEHGRRPGS